MYKVRGVFIMKKDKKIYKIILYLTFAMTLFLSINVLLAFLNICYLPPNTTGECVIAHSLMSNNVFIPFIVVETIVNIIITILYLIDGIKYKIKLNNILCILNILLQPIVLIIIFGVAQ